MKNKRILLLFFAAIVFAIVLMPTKVNAAQTITSVELELVEPVLGETYTPIKLKLKDSSSNSLISAVKTFNVLCTTTNEKMEIVGFTAYNNPGIYCFEIDLAVDTNIACFQGAGNNYTGSLTLNGENISYSAASSSSLKVFFSFDLREKKYVEDLEFIYYPVIGESIHLFEPVFINENVYANIFHFKYIEGTGWEQIFEPGEIYTKGTKYKIEFYYVCSNTYMLDAKNKTATAIENVYDILINFNNEQIHANFDENSEILAFEYEYDPLKDKFDVTYNTDGIGTAPSNETVTPGNKVTKPSDLTAENYTFGGWYTDEECTTAYDFDKKVYNDITLYAKWTDNETYTVLEGNNQSFTKGQASSYSFRVDGDYSKFLSFAVDGVIYVKDVDYTVTKGSTIITLTQTGIDKLNSLGEGAHNFKVEYSNSKSVTGSFTIAGTTTSTTSSTTSSATTASVKDVTPKTGTTSIIEYAIGIITLTGMGIILLKKKI